MNAAEEPMLEPGAAVRSHHDEIDPVLGGVLGDPSIGRSFEDLCDEFDAGIRCHGFDLRETRVAVSRPTSPERA